MRTAEVRTLFDYLKEHQAPLVKAVADAEPLPEPPPRSFPLELQKQFELEVVRKFGFDDESWRLDPTVHPFASGAGTQDIRITTRYFDGNLDGLFATMHECGHGLYEHQIDPALDRTPLSHGTSLGMHESQSRMWENLVGRSLPFWRYFFPRLQELFPDAVRGYDAERWYREVNAVEPSLIRVEADEATYNLHIILRFELEQELLAETFPLEQLPEEWNRRMWDYLGIEVPDDTRGVLQDIHWSSGAIGYFPTYALGNLISAQLWEKIVARPARSRRRVRARRVRRAARVAAREPAPARAQVHAQRDPRARDRRPARGSTPSRTCAICGARSERSTGCRSTSRSDAERFSPEASPDSD